MLLIAADLAMMLGLLISWGLVGYGEGKIRVMDQDRIRSAARKQLIRIAIGLLFTLGKGVTFTILATSSWLFVQDTVIVHLALIFLPAATTLALFVPPLLAVARGRSSVSMTERPTLTVKLPMQLAGIGAVMDFIITLFYPAQAAQPLNLLFILLIDASFVAVAVQTHMRQEAKVTQQDLPKKRRLPRTSIVAVVLLFAISGWFILSAQASRLPDRMSMMSGTMNYGGGPGEMNMDGQQHDMVHKDGSAELVPVTDLTGPAAGEPDEQFTLVAEKQTIQMGSGPTVEAWTFNGQSPGPELRVTQGDLVEVKLINKDITDGVTVHWHGLDVPNAEDGVAGVTQDAVQPGQTYTYRFRADQAGTFWYHSHQHSLEQVKKGLFGALVVTPRGNAQPVGLDITAILHSWTTIDGSSVGTFDVLDRRKAAPGTPVRFRLINTGDWPDSYYLSGVPFKVASIDGTDVNGPSELVNERLEVAAGGRYDITFTMPDHPVLLSNGSPDGGILLSGDDKENPPAIVKGTMFDPLSYGQSEATPFGSDSQFDRSFTMIFDNKLGFYDGSFERLFTINGEVFPQTPMLMVKEGDLVKTTFTNRSLVPHPMHLHGHHMLVLSRNGKPVTGSPWWSDTLNVNPGESYDVAFIADNPGVWMDHCHNLEHAAIGMTLHLAYERVMSPFEVGHATQNRPE